MVNLVYPPRRLVEHNGQMLPMSIVAKRVGMTHSTLRYRMVVCGMTLAEALAKPVRKNERR